MSGGSWARSYSHRFVYDGVMTSSIHPAHDQALSYHPGTAGRAETHEALRTAAREFCAVVDELCPPSRESALAFTALQETLMWANAAVAIHSEERKV